MIAKLSAQMADDLLNFFSVYGIKLTAKYVPELPGLLTYSRNFLARTLNMSPVSIDGRLYQDALLYRLGTPKLAEYAAHNNFLTVISDFADVGQEYEMESVGNQITKLRTSTDEGSVKTRDVSIMQIPVEFAIMSENINQLFAIISLFYAQLVSLTELTIPLDIFDSGTPAEFKYFMNWDRDSLELTYANFENNSSLNVLMFNCMVSGAVFSEFYRESHIIDLYKITTGFIHQEE